MDDSKNSNYELEIEYNTKKKLKSLSYTIGNTYMTESNSFARLSIIDQKARNNSNLQNI
ncbi:MULTISPECIES: hypothetical protein [Wolbachia]|uniref:hypothetical protein n=1 Tax=Wolbachia TaxID=953 RepID=UPI001293CC14|nr:MULTISPECIES: hypothetical protein [Wolbachia]MBA8753763.1 hypothetical protein [Wolbachia pipientis]MDU8921056.1 hypothetical protein [Wolbachia endosymbiont of Scaptomyza pallida]